MPSGRRCLVVIPITKVIPYLFGFSAPLAWLFSGHVDQVRGVYGHELDEATVRDTEYFIVELNWFTELYEFEQLVRWIKRVNPKSKILFGGLYSQLAYPKLFARNPLDYFIRGDAEVPMAQFLDGVDPRKIPNMVGRDFERPIEYCFRAADYGRIEYNLDWFPSYFRHIDAYPSGDMQMYRMPMIITARGGCPIAHEGCDYCLGAQIEKMREMYGRPLLRVSNTHLKRLIRKAERFGKFCLYIISECDYDLRGIESDAEVTMEIDSYVEPATLDRIIRAFKTCYLTIPLHREGIMGRRIIENWTDFLALGDENHVIKFAAYPREADLLQHLPQESVVYLLDAFRPAWAHYKSYSRFVEAAKNSHQLFGWSLWKLDQLGIRPANEVYDEPRPPSPQLPPQRR